MSTAVNLKEKYSYADYLSWPEGERWELIEGQAYNMTPAPSRKHQTVLGNLHVTFFNYFKGKPCRVILAPFDVRLASDYSDNERILTVVQPDLSVFCDTTKLDDKGATGAPDLVVEILSSNTAEKDMKTKLLLYQNFGVKEYWLVNPDKKEMEIILPDSSGKYQPGRVYTMEQTASSSLYEGLSIDVREVFQD